MKEETGCNLEMTVVKALKSGFINQEISRHIEECANCRETVKVMRFFQANLPKESLPKHMPAAGLVWWKFKLREKQKRAARVGQPILFAQTIAILITFGTFIWFKQTDKWQSLGLDTVINQTFASLEIIAFPFFTGIISVAIVSLVLILILRQLLPDK